MPDWRKLGQLEDIVERVLGWPHAGRLERELRFKSVDRGNFAAGALKMEQMRIEVDYKPCSEALIVTVSKGQIQQVVLNLILNAVAVMPDGVR